jgi:phosphohistidine phosphatase
VHRLFIVRHAKAATHPPTASGGDHERPLAPRGAAVLPGVARNIAELLDGHPLDLIVCSTSARTQETVAHLVAAAPAIASARLKLDSKLYLADAARLLKIVRKLPAGAETVLMCGHNPGLHELALLLLAADATPERLRYDLPTAGVVVLDIEDAWTSAGTSTGTSAGTSAGTTAATLRAFVVPSAD